MYINNAIYQQMRAGQLAYQSMAFQIEGPAEANPGLITESGPLSRSRQAEFDQAVRRERLAELRRRHAARPRVPVRTSGGSQPTRATRSRVETAMGGPGLNRRNIRGGRPVLNPVANRIAEVRAMGGSVEECRHPTCSAITIDMSGQAEVFCIDHGGR